MKKYKLTVIILAVLLLLESVLLLFLLLRQPKRVAFRPGAVPVRGKIAIVLDDWGYNTRNLAALDKIKYPVTFSVLPNLRYSAFISREIHSRGFEVILHLPMEPREKYRLEDNTILTSMGEAQIQKIIDTDLKSVAPVKGVSNHMGSRATEDRRTIGIIFRELKKRHLYFLDSFVSGNSVCQELAAKTGIGFAARDIFLDNKEDSDYIRGQVTQLKKKAAIHGYAIGIGHDRRNTLMVLEEMMPQLSAEGYRFVLLSEVVR